MMSDPNKKKKEADAVFWRRIDQSTYTMLRGRRRNHVFYSAPTPCLAHCDGSFTTLLHPLTCTNDLRANEHESKAEVTHTAVVGISSCR